MIFSVVMVIAHAGLAVVLFFLVNWIGKHAEEFGYTTSTLFEEVTEDAALNLFLKALAPAVFILVLSAVAVALGRPEWRIDIYWVAVYYYLGRAFFLVVWGRSRLVRWTRFVALGVIGIGSAGLVYKHLILPNRSLLPNVDQIGNELWLAIAAFLYAVANRIPMKSGPKDRQTNGFIKSKYEHAVLNYGSQIDAQVGNDLTLKLIVYSVLIYEDYARPAPARMLERMFWNKKRTTGVMQVRGEKAFSDADSVVEGTSILTQAWYANEGEQWHYDRMRSTIHAYNRDENYSSRVFDVMRVLALRVDRRFEPAYEGQ